MSDHCKRCGKPKPVGMRQDAKFCGATCRSAYHKDMKALADHLKGCLGCKRLVHNHVKGLMMQETLDG